MVQKIYQLGTAFILSYRRCFIKGIPFIHKSMIIHIFLKCFKSSNSINMIITIAKTCRVTNSVSKCHICEYNLNIIFLQVRYCICPIAVIIISLSCCLLIAYFCFRSPYCLTFLDMQLSVDVVGETSQSYINLSVLGGRIFLKRF